MCCWPDQCDMHRIDHMTQFADLCMYDQPAPVCVASTKWEFYVGGIAEGVVDPVGRKNMPLEE